MLLANKNAVIYGAAGATGSAVARAFAREGARVFVTGRDIGAVKSLATEIVASGGVAEAATVDALDEGAIEDHLADVVASAQQIDISYNAIGLPQTGLQGIPLIELPSDSFVLPLATYGRSHFLTARAAARRMTKQGCGVIMMHTPEPARFGAALVGGMGPAWSALESFCRSLSAEVGPSGVRVVGLRTTGIPETKTIDLVFDLHARAVGITRQQFQGFVEGMTHRKRSTTLAELANAAVFLASKGAASMTGTVANLTGGIAVD